MKKRSNLFIIIFFLSGFLNCTSHSSAQNATQIWEYKSSYNKSYYLERKWLSDTVFIDKYFFTESDVFWSDTFYIKDKECYFKRGNIYYPYLSQSSFEKGDTIKYYYQEAVNTAGNLFMIRDFLLPDKQNQKEGGLLVYKLVSPVDDPKYSTSKIYFDPKRNLITRITTIDGVRMVSDN